MYTREMGTICPFGALPCFIVFFALQSVVFWELEKAILGPKRTSGEFGFQDPKTT